MIGRMHSSCGTITRAQRGQPSCHTAERGHSSRLTLTPRFGQSGIENAVTHSLRYAYIGMPAGTGRTLRSSRQIVGLPAVSACVRLLRLFFYRESRTLLKLLEGTKKVFEITSIKLVDNDHST